jgi:hypothetical protein
MRRPSLMLAAVLLMGTGLIAQPFDSAQGGQAAPTNLKVLPKDMTRQQVTRVMRGFTSALGVRCQHCHVGEGNDLSKFDFASDAKPTKEIARKMMLMAADINAKYRAGIVVPAPPAAPDAAAPAAPPAAAAPTAPAAPPGPKVTCFTCHRGALKPVTAPPPGEGRGGGARLLRF